MEKKSIDCRGLSCPQPVMETKKGMDDFRGDILEITVDNEIACENVSRFAASRNWAVEKIARNAGEICLSFRRPAEEMSEAGAHPKAKPETFLLYCPSDTIGRGDDELGRLLMRTFIKSLLDTSPLPQRMIFLNAGVKLATDGSPVLDTLKEFESRGVEIVSCGTCLDYFSLKDKLRVGKVTNMFDIISSLQTFDHVVQP